MSVAPPSRGFPPVHLVREGGCRGFLPRSGSESHQTGMPRSEVLASPAGWFRVDAGLVGSPAERVLTQCQRVV